MSDSADGIFDFEQLNAIRDAHRDWCTANAIDPSSQLGQETAAVMLEAFQSGQTSRQQLISACDEHASLNGDRIQP